MHFQIFNTNRISVWNIGDIIMPYVMPVNYNNKTAADGFHFIPFHNKHARIFTQTNSNA